MTLRSVFPHFPFELIAMCLLSGLFGVFGISAKARTEDRRDDEAASVSVAQPAEEIAIVADGICQATLMMGETASETERYAAEELGDALKKMSGADLAQGRGAVRIRLGTPESSAEVRRQASRLGLDLPGERIAVCVVDGELFLAGSTPSAALHAAYAFLNHLGVRWLWPGDTGEFIPLRKTVAVSANLNLREKPALRYRGLHMIHKSNPETEIWMARNRMNYIRSSPNPASIAFRRKLGFVITVAGHSVAPVEKDFAGHPEYYALVGGQRRTDLLRPHVCWSNPDVRDYFAKRTIRHLDEFDIDLYQLYPTDSQTYCECEACTKADRCTSWHRFLTDVAARIRQKHPEAKLGTLAYQGYLPLPRCDVGYLDYLEFCMYGRCYRHLFSEKCSVNEKELELLKAWIGTGVSVTVRGYEFDVFNPPMPLPLAYLMPDQMRTFRDLGVEGYFTEADAAGTPKFDGARLSWYALARSAWNPDESYDQIAAEWCETAFGAAAVPMRAYYRLFEQAWRDIPGDISYYSHTPGPTARKLLDDAKIRQAQTLFDAAKTIAEGLADSTARQKLLERIGFEQAQFSIWADLSRSAAATRAGIPVKAPELSYEASAGDMAELEESSLWNSAGRIPALFDKSGRESSNRTELRVFHTDKAVYLRAICFDAQIGCLQAMCREHDGPVYGDESIELFLRVPDQPTGEYYHLVANSAKTRYDAIGKGGMKFDVAWNPVWNVRVRKLEDRWICDIELPFSEFGGRPSAGSDWQFSIKRTRGKRADLEHSGFPDASFHNPDAFGILWFVTRLSPGIALYRPGIPDGGSALGEELAQVLQIAPDYAATPDVVRALLEGERCRLLFLRVVKREEGLSDAFIQEMVAPWVERGGLLVVSAARHVSPEVWFDDDSLKVSRHGGMLPDMALKDATPAWSLHPHDLTKVLLEHKNPDGAFGANETAWRILARSSDPDGRSLAWLLTTQRGSGHLVLTSAGLGCGGGLQAFGSDVASAAALIGNLEAFFRQPSGLSVP